MPTDSKNISKVLIEKDNKYLVLVRTDNMKFDLPGGHCHIGEGFEVGAIREVWEETRLICLHLEEVASSSRKKVFICKSFEGNIVLDEKENFKYNWMTIEDIFNLQYQNCTDVLMTAKSHFLKDPDFWK